MRTKPVKKKMKKGSKAGDRIKRLREETLRENQAQFAQRLGVDQARISQYESGKLVPTAEVYVTLGNLAAYPESLWFWEQIGINRAMISSKADEILKERVQVPLADRTPEGIEKTQIVVPLPERFVPNPDSTICLVLDKKSAGLVFDEGDVVVLEPASDPQGPQPYWDKIVLLEFPEQGPRNLNWPTGLFMGRLRCKCDAFSRLAYYATVGPLTDSESTWAPGRGESIIIGAWEHPGPPEKPDGGSDREKAKAQSAKVGAEYMLVREKYTHGSITVDTPELQAARARLQEAESRISIALQQEKETAEQEAKKQGPEELRVSEGCKIIGRVVAWFKSPKD